MNSRFHTNIAATITAVAIVGITLVAAFSVAAIVVGASHTALATKGEAASHISPQGAEHQASQGAANSGVCSSCGRSCCL